MLTSIPSRLKAGVLAACLLATTAASAAPARAGGAGVATCSPNAHASTQARYLCAQPGDLIDVTLGDLHPTQAILGDDEVYYKLGRYRLHKDEAAGAFNKRFDDWCEANGQGAAASVSGDARLDDSSTFTCTVPRGAETPDTIAPMKTAVIGPGGRLYLTDGHHTFTSFLESPDGGPDTQVRVRVTGNLAGLSPSAFWRAMKDNRWVWLRDENDQPLTVDQLPAHLGLANFHNDPSRGLVYFTRDIGYVVPDDAPEFLEFYWGSWLRDHGFADLSGWDLNDRSSYLDLVKQASQAMAAVDDSDVINPDGTTAGEVGKIGTWNDGKAADKGEFAKLSKPITDARPGKIAYALDFKADAISPPTCTTTVTGPHNGPLTVTSGVLCLDRAAQHGGITVGSGASLVALGSTISGSVHSTAADTIYLCGDAVTGPVTITKTKGSVFLGGTGCTANTISGPVQLTDNTGGVTVAANEVRGRLSCSGNDPAPDNADRPNDVRGAKSGQCSLL